MHANNETGVVQPMEAIAEIVRARRARGQAIYFHSDGVQAFGKIAPQAPAADLYSISAHKIYGPKGIGALLARKNVPLNNIQFGGRHERGRRPGTENVAGAIAFAKAVELCDASDRDHLSGLRNRFESQVLSAVSEVTINGIRAPRLPNTSNITFEGVPAEALLIALDLKGMAVSTGSACASGAVEPSHVLLAMRLSRESAASSLRFSFGRFNSVEDVDRLGEEVIRAVRQLRTSRVSEAILV
jgi:cysteine desulfurase